MKIIVFGASGSVGRFVVAQALEQGHEVTAFTRNRASIDQQHDRLAVREGDVFDAAALAPVVAGHDAAIITLGGGAKGGVRARGTAAVIAAMRESGARRLVVQSTIGAGDSRVALNFTWKYLMFGLLLRRAYADHQEQEQITRASGLDWTIVRPGAFTDGPRTGEYRRGFTPRREKKTPKISRADVADFLLEQLTDPTWVGRAAAQAYPAAGALASGGGAVQARTGSSERDAHVG